MPLRKFTVTSPGKTLVPVAHLWTGTITLAVSDRYGTDGKEKLIANSVCTLPATRLSDTVKRMRQSPRPVISSKFGEVSFGSPHDSDAEPPASPEPGVRRSGDPVLTTRTDSTVPHRHDRHSTTKSQATCSGPRTARKFDSISIAVHAGIMITTPTTHETFRVLTLHVSTRCRP